MTAQTSTPQTDFDPQAEQAKDELRLAISKACATQSAIYGLENMITLNKHGGPLNPVDRCLARDLEELLGENLRAAFWTSTRIVELYKDALDALTRKPQTDEPAPAEEDLPF